MDHAFDYLDAPIKRISTAEAPMPYAKNLEALLSGCCKDRRGGERSFLGSMNKKSDTRIQVSHRPMGVIQQNTQSLYRLEQ